MGEVTNNRIVYNHHNAGAEYLVRDGGGWERVGMRIGESGVRRLLDGPRFWAEDMPTHEDIRIRKFGYPWRGTAGARIFVPIGTSNNNYYQLSGEPLNSYDYGLNNNRVMVRKTRHYGPEGLLPRWRLFYSSMYVVRSRP